MFTHCLLLPMHTSGSPLTVFVSFGVKSAPPDVNPSGSAKIMSGSGIVLSNFPVFRRLSAASWCPCSVMIVQFFALAIGGRSLASIFLGKRTYTTLPRGIAYSRWYDRAYSVFSGFFGVL